MESNFIYIKKSWNFIKQKNSENCVMGYEELYDGIYRVFSIENNIKYFVVLYPPNRKDVAGLENTNDLDYQDFVSNYKQNIDKKPPLFLFPVDLPNLLKTGNKLQTHDSSRPDSKTKKYISCWSSTGDDIVNHVIWGGNEAVISAGPEESEKIVDICFDPYFGDVWLKEGYAAWENAQFGCCLYVSVFAHKTNLQNVSNLNLVLEDDNRVKFSPNGPNTGTHGFASTPVLVPNHFSNGWWDYDETNGLTPNPMGLGKFDIYNTEKEVMRFLNKIYIMGSNHHYFKLESKEISKIVSPYFLRLRYVNVPGTSSKIVFFMSLYREIV